MLIHNLKQHRWFLPSLKIFIFLVASGYVAYLIAGLFLGYLGANPVEELTHETGEWGLNFLLLTLLVTPARKHLRWSQLIQLRRFLGLWCFAFIVLHFLTFAIFDHALDLNSILEDILERRYITVGLISFILLIPLAVTSFVFFQRLLKKHWVTLHRLIYPIAILGIVHYWWLVKADILWPLIYGILLMLLLADRVYWSWQKNKRIPK